MNKQAEPNRNEGPIDLIKKEGLFVDLTNQTQTIQQQSNDGCNNIVKDKIRKQIANTPVIIENPEANRFQMINNTTNNSRLQQYYSNESQNNNLLSASTINANNPSPLVDLQMDQNSSPINSNEIIHDQQDLLNNNNQDKQQIVHDNSWFEDPNNVLDLKEQIQQQFRTPTQSQPAIHNKIASQQSLNRCPSIPVHVFNSGEKFRRHSDSTAEILNNQQNINYHQHPAQQNGLMNHHNMNNHHHNPISQNSIQQPNSTTNQMQAMNSLHQHAQPMDYEANVNNQIENNNNLVNFDYRKRKQPTSQIRTETETSANDRTMETIPESQLINSTTPNNSSHYLQPNNHLTNSHHQVFYNNNNNSNNNNCNNQLAFQSHSVPTTPTVVNQQYSNQNHDYHDQQLSNQISHHHHHSTNHQQLNQQHSLPCTPKQPTSFTFSPHQVQHYQQQSYHNNHNNHYNSSPNTPCTPCTPCTPVTPTTNCNQQYQDNLIGVQRQATTNLHAQQVIQQSNQTGNNVHKNLNSLYPTVEFNNNTICPRTGGKFNQHQLNYGTMIGSHHHNHHHQFLDSNDNHITTADHLNNNTYSTMMNDDYMVTETNAVTGGYNEQQQFANCLDTNQRNLNYQLNNNTCSNTTSSNNYSNVIMSNYTGTPTNDESFCETNLTSTNCTNQQLNQSNNGNLLNDELTKDNELNSASTAIINNQSLNCPTTTTITNNTCTTPEKPTTYKRMTLRSVSPNLVIETESFKNSTADDSQTYSNLNADDEDDDVFLKPTEINSVPISSPKNNFLNNSSTSAKKSKSRINLASGTYLAGTNNAHHSSTNLPQVDFTHPQQPKMASSAINLNKNEINRKSTDVEHCRPNDMSFNQATFSSSSADKANQIDLTNDSSMDYENQTIDKQTNNRSSSPKRTKHRPEPLYIPPHVNALIHKSSRVWSALNENPSSNLSLPYTPPPMLSPIRTSSSYYWHILTGNLTPKTFTNFFGTKKNLDQQQQSILNQTAVLNQQSIVNKSRSFDFFNANNETNHIPTPSTAYEPLDSCLPNVETTFDFSTYSNSSVNAHVNIGVQYQARIPAFNPNKKDARLHYRNERADKVWSPSILDNLTSSNGILDDSKQCKAITNSKRKINMLKELELYLELACSACIMGNGRNKEYAYHILHQNNGDLNKSIK